MNLYFSTTSMKLENSFYEIGKNGTCVRVVEHMVHVCKHSSYLGKQNTLKKNIVIYMYLYKDMLSST